MCKWGEHASHGLRVVITIRSQACGSKVAVEMAVHRAYMYACRLLEDNPVAI
jgi:hypothetical protein